MRDHELIERPGRGWSHEGRSGRSRHRKGLLGSTRAGGSVQAVRNKRSRFSSSIPAQKRISELAEVACRDRLIHAVFLRHCRARTKPLQGSAPSVPPARCPRLSLAAEPSFSVFRPNDGLSIKLVARRVIDFPAGIDAHVALDGAGRIERSRKSRETRDGDIGHGSHAEESDQRQLPIPTRP